jgi:hypothetical protein
MKFRLPQPFCAPNCPRMSGKCDRWHKSCFRCPIRKVLLQKGNWWQYHYDDILGHIAPIQCSIFSLYVRYDCTVLFYSNDLKHLHSVKDIMVQDLLYIAEKHRKYLQYAPFLKLFVQIIEELCK